MLPLEKTSRQFRQSNPLLGQGQLGIETDTGYRKLGDGVSSWKALSYIGTGDLKDDEVFSVVSEANSQTRGALNGLYARIDRERKNILNYGVANDGTGNQTAAIKAALDGSPGAEAHSSCSRTRPWCIVTWACERVHPGCAHPACHNLSDIA